MILFLICPKKFFILIVHFLYLHKENEPKESAADHLVSHSAGLPGVLFLLLLLGKQKKEIFKKDYLKMAD